MNVTSTTQNKKKIINLILMPISLGLLLVVSIISYAPHIPRLLWEGFPNATWPAKGTFAKVEGEKHKNANQIQRTSTTHPNDWLKKLIKTSKTKALIAYSPDKPIFTYYENGITNNTQFNSFSMVKSLVGLLIVKALAEGKIASLDTSITDILTHLPDSSLKSVTIKDVMDMKSGIMFETDGVKTASGINEKDLEAALANPFGPMAILHIKGPQSISSKLKSSPEHHGKFSYQNVNTALLGMILEKIYKKPLNEILSEKIWKPAGAKTVHWRKYSKSTSVTPYCLLICQP